MFNWIYAFIYIIQVSPIEIIRMLNTFAEKYTFSQKKKNEVKQQ